MCTAISYKTNDTYFGRNLDLERGYGESVVVTPRAFPFRMRHVQHLDSHYALIGMATVINDYPLYYEATNETGLSMAGLSFPGNAVYHPYAEGRDNVAPFEFIPWLLGRCADLSEAEELLSRINLVNTNFSDNMPLSPLHWMISDKERSIVVESLAGGLKIYDNPFEVLTNNPTFDYHTTNMSNYMSLHSGAAESRFRSELPLNNYSLNMGALGLPGDFSSASRFVKAVFVKENAAPEKDDNSSVNHFFHMLNAVAMPKGCVWTKNGFEYTRYSSCCNANKGIYYYTTYNDLTIRSVNMHGTDLDGTALSSFPVDGLE